jgi:hypothetical protein
MAETPVIADTFRCALDWVETDGATAATVFHVFAPGKSETEINAAVGAAWSSDCMHNVSSRATISGISIQALDGESGTLNFPFASEHLVGLGSAECAIEACTLVQFKTTQKGARGRGRIYLPFLPDDAFNGGKLVGSNLTAPHTGFQAWKDDMVADDSVVLVVASYVHGDQHTVLSVNIDPVIGVQRRRVARLRH